MMEPNEIIEAIHHCIADESFIQRREGPYCAGCPYEDDPVCVATLKSDIQKILKAQEPRLYTVEELKRGEHYYLELHLELTGDGIHYAEISSIDRWSDKLHGKFKAYDLLYDERGAVYMYEWSYGWTWRCWTSHPTDEQRKAIPWLLVKNSAE